MTISVVERWRPSMASCDPRVEYTGAIASTPGTARNSSSCASVNGRPDTAASAPTCSAAERSMPARTVPSSTDENTATETPTTTASTGTSPALGSRSARADPRNGTSPGSRRGGADQPRERDRVEAEHDDARHERQQQRHGREQRIDTGLRGRRRRARGAAAAPRRRPRGARRAVRRSSGSGRDRRPPRSALARRSGLSAGADATRSAAGVTANAAASSQPPAPAWRRPRASRRRRRRSRPGTPMASPSIARMPRSCPTEAPRAAASSRPARRRSKTTRAPSTSTAIMTPIGPEAIVASTASLAAAATAASPSAAPSPLRKPTSPTVATQPPTHSPEPSVCTPLENSPSWPMSRVVSSAVMRSGQHGDPGLHDDRQVDLRERGPRGRVDEGGRRDLGGSESVVGDHRGLERAGHVGPEPVVGVGRRDRAGQPEGLVHRADADEALLAELPFHALGDRVGEHDLHRGAAVELPVDRRGPVARRQRGVLAEARVEAGQHPVHGRARGGPRHDGAHRAHHERGERGTGDAAQRLGRASRMP